MKTEHIIRLNQVIGKALRETAHEAHSARIESMKARPFDEVVTAIKNKKITGQNKANGYFVSDAVRYFNDRLEKEYEEILSEVEAETAEWFKAIEKFRW